MKIVRSWLLAAAVGLAGIMSTQAPATAQAPAASSSSEVSKPTVVSKIKKWTQARLAAAKKRWAEDNAKFTDCQRQLTEQRKVKRLSLNRQGHFLQDCMIRKP